MIGHTWELLLDCFWVAGLQNVVIIAEHLISLDTTTKMERYCSVFLSALCYVFDLSSTIKAPEQYHEEIDVVVVILVVGVVHAEGSVDVTTQDVIKLLKGPIGELSRSSEALPQVGPFKTDITINHKVSHASGGIHQINSVTCTLELNHFVKRDFMYNTFEEKSVSFLIWSDCVKLDSITAVR